MRSQHRGQSGVVPKQTVLRGRVPSLLSNVIIHCQSLPISPSIMVKPKRFYSMFNISAVFGPKLEQAGRSVIDVASSNVKMEMDG
jgi:hypothetical protein